MLVIPAILTTYKSLKDRTLVLSFETNEPTPEQLTQIALSCQNAGFLAFNKDVFKSEQLKLIDEIKADYDDKIKTPSKRLRDVLFVAFKQNNEGFEVFEDYYRSKMEKFINHVKTKLE
jgi:hypothetical protein